MLPHRRDPYLWIHLAGLATVPLWLDVCLVGLAVGEPAVPPWLELTVLAAVSTMPMVWMQWRRPFYIFSVPGLALRPDKLSLERRRLLTLQRGWLSRSLVLLAAIALLWALYTLYQLAPMATDLPWLAGKSRATGWSIGAIAFLLANLFALVPATVVPLFLTSPSRLAKVSPIAADQVLQNFTVVGLRISKILPEPKTALPEAESEMAMVTPPAPAEAAVQAADSLADAPEVTVAASGEATVPLPSPPNTSDLQASNEGLPLEAREKPHDNASLGEETPLPDPEVETSSVSAPSPPSTSTAVHPPAAADAAIAPDQSDRPVEPVHADAPLPDTEAVLEESPREVTSDHGINTEATEEIAPADTLALAADDSATDQIASLEELTIGEVDEAAQNPSITETLASQNGVGSLNSPQADET